MPAKFATLWLAVALATASFLATGAPAPSQSSAIQPSQYVHQSWTIRDGAPAAVCAIAQGPDGYLWLGTGSGLYRFDGVEFSRYQALPGQHLITSNITALRFTHAGDLWIGSYDGGGTLLRNGKVQSWTNREGFPQGWVINFAEGLDNEVWVATGQGLGRFEKGRWESIGRDWNYPYDRADWVLFDREGTLWVAAVNQLVYLPRGGRRFESTNIALAPSAMLALDREGTVWVSDRLHGTRRLPGLSAAHATVEQPNTLPVTDQFAAARIAFDQSNGLWATALNNASVFHAARENWPAAGMNITTIAAGSLFEPPQRLTSNTAIPVAIDREDTVWVGTGIGIDSYHRSQVGTLRDFNLEPKTHLGITNDTSGHLWMSSFDTVYELKGNTFTPIITAVPDTIVSIVKDRDDLLWIIGFHDLFRFVDGRLEKVPLPNHLYASRLKLVTPGPKGVLWASLDGVGLFRFKDNEWTAWQPRTKGLGATPTTGQVDEHGAMWLGYADGTLLEVAVDGGEHLYRLPAGSEIGTINIIDVGTRTILLGGSAGLARLQNGRLESLTDQDYPSLTGVTGLLREKTGDVWINTGRGITRFTAGELDKAFANPLYRPDTGNYDFRDGIHGSARQGQPVESMQRDDSGRIWFLTIENLYWIDPPSQQRNRIPPPVYIDGILADEKRIKSGDNVTLPPGTSALQLNYTALSLTSPSRVRFRYQLQGEDPAWVDPGTRRQAFYTNLAPGSYHFNVIASNDQGVWNERGSSIGITIPPRFYQTWWFHTLEGLAALALIGLAFVLRVRHVSRTVRLQSDARYEERERIARELHDTLLQAIYGIVLRFQAVAIQMPDSDPLKKDVRGTLKVASDFIIEGRDRVRDLRSKVVSTQALSEALLELARTLRDASPIAVETSVRVVDHPMDAAVAEELLAIGRESLVNAMRHSGATRIDVSLACTHRSVTLRVADDGIGIPAALLDHAREAGHWGIPGMRERAALVGGELTIHSRPGETSIEVTTSLHLTASRHRPGH